MSTPDLRTLTLPHGTIRLPAFLPDGTQGVVRGVDARDLAASGVQALQMNVFHLMQRPGSTTIRALGGLHRMCGWEGPIVTDSGGFQAYSLVRQSPGAGHLDRKGILFRPEGGARKVLLTPEKSIQLQLSYGADILICLDDCTHPDAPLEEQRASVERTILWARRCKEAYRQLTEAKSLGERERPLLFAVIQGGTVRELRRYCAETLLEIGFDGFGFGGWPLDSQGRLLEEVLAYTRELVPGNFPMHALGIGHPRNLVTCARLGYGLFDSVLPTRDARRGRLYAFTSDSPTISRENGWFTYRYIADERYRKADEPVSPSCDCLACTGYSLGYLHHLFKLDDCLYVRLATLHNLRFMTRLTEMLREDV